NSTPTLRYPVTSVKEQSRTIAFGDSRGGGIPHGGHSMTLDPPHMVVRFDNLRVDSPYWLQAPFNGTALAGVNPYGPDEGTADAPIPFSPAEARHRGRANVVFLEAHVESQTLAGLCLSLVTCVPQFTKTPFDMSSVHPYISPSEGPRTTTAKLPKGMAEWPTSAQHMKRMITSPYLPVPDTIQGCRAHRETACNQAARIAKALEATPCT